MYEKHIKVLAYYEKDCAKALFLSLQRLDEVQRKILADKYYHSDEETNYYNEVGRYTTVKPNTDKEVAEQYGIPQKEFSKLRIRAESDLGYLYSIAYDEVTKADMNKLDEFVFKMGQLYVKEDRTANRDEVLMTTDHKKAKVFTEDNYYLSALDTWQYEKSRTYQDKRLLELENMNK